MHLTVLADGTIGDPFIHGSFLGPGLGARIEVAGEAGTAR